jgi:hypothetical protein
MLATSSSSSRYPMPLAMNFCSISPINLDHCCFSAPICILASGVCQMHIYCPRCHIRYI